METTIGHLKDEASGEKLGVDGEVLELSKKENLDLSSGGLEDTDADEVFEEAVEPETPVINSEKSQEIAGGNMESVVSLENGDQDLSSASVIHKSEDFVGVIDAAQHSEHDGAQDVIPVDEAETQNGMDEVVRDETNGLDDGTNAVVKEAKFKEIVDLAPNDGQSNYPSYFYEVLRDLNHGDAVSENVTSLGTLNFEDSKDVEADTVHESTADVFETPRFNVSNGIESDPEKPDSKGYMDGIVEIQDANEVNEDDVGSVKPENGILHHSTTTDTSINEDTKSGADDVHLERLEMTSSAIKDDIDVKRSEGDSRPESESERNACQIDEQNGIAGEAGVGSESKSNGDIIHATEGNVTANEPVAVLGNELMQEKEMSDASVPNVGDVDKPEDLELGSSDSQIVDNAETTGVTAADISSGNASEGNEVETNLPPLVESSTSDLDIAKAEKLNLASSTSLAESPTAHQEERGDASDTVSEAFADVPEKEGIKDGMKEAVSVNKEQECEIMLPSSGESTISTTSAHRPEHTADIQKTVSGDTRINGEKEVKPNVDISSSAETMTTRPAGLGHTAPLLQPTQNAAGNKESGSRSVPDIQSTKTTAAAPPPARPAGLGRDAPLLEPATRVAQHPRVNGGTSPPHNQLVEDQSGDAEEYDETREKLQMIRVKFLRLAHRLGQTPHNVVVAQVLYRLGLAEQLRGRSGGRVGAFSFDRASAMAEQLEAAGQEPLDFTCTIMVLGKSGVGKSATINSIFDENMFGTDAFQLGTKKVQDIVGTVQGIRVRVIDTPGLLPSWSDQRQNEKILHSVKRFIKKTPPDIVLYLDRLDMQGRDFGETPLLRTITDIFGPSIWFNAIVVLTHAASAPPEGPNGTATSYDMFVTQRSHIVQQAIRQAAGDMRLMNPVSLVENHSACRTNRAGQRVLPNGQVWKPHLLLLSFASKILAEANTLLKLQDSPPGKPFAPRRSPPLPFLLSSLLQSRPEVKLPSEQFDDDDDAVDDDLEESSDSEDEVGYDELPPFKSLTKAQLEKLPKSQRKAYYDEIEYREKLFMKKQLKEEKKRRRMMKKMQEAVKDLPPEFNESAEEESAGAASVPVPMPDLSLPASFDSDYPTHRYRSLDSNPWIVRAVLEPNGWDHDVGYDGINAERLFVVKDKVPISFSGHISKDKKDASLQMEVASSVKHGKGKSTSLGFEMQSVGKDMVYTMRSETKFSNRKINKAAAGLSATLLGDVLTGGIKLEDKLLIGKRGQVVLSGGGIYGRGDVAYGGSLEATLRDKDHPLGRFLSTLGVSVMDWHGDLAIGWNSQTQIPVGRSSNLIARFNLSNRGSGQVSVRVNSSEHLQIVLIGLIPLVKKLLGNDRNG